jgi:hypothetical protein
VRTSREAAGAADVVRAPAVGADAALGDQALERRDDVVGECRVEVADVQLVQVDDVGPKRRRLSAHACSTAATPTSAPSCTCRAPSSIR